MSTSKDDLDQKPKSHMHKFMQGYTIEEGMKAIDQQRQIDQATLRQQRLEMQRRALLNRTRTSGIPARYLTARFDALGPEQATASKQCERYAACFAEAQSRGGNVLLQGHVGTGKTYLACAIGLALMARGHSVLFATEDEILVTIRSTYHHNAEYREEDILQEYSSADLLIIDDCGRAIGQPDKRAHMLFRVIDRRYRELKPTVLTSNLSLDRLEEHLGYASWDRLTDANCMVVQFNWQSYRALTA